MIKQPSLTLPLMLRPRKREWRDQGTCFHTTNAVQAKKRKNAYWYSLGIPEGALLDTAFGNLYQATRTLPSLPSTWPQ